MCMNLMGLSLHFLSYNSTFFAFSQVGPQAVYVVGRDDDDESTGAESDSSDAASWETVDDDDKGAPEIPEEVCFVEKCD